MEFFGGFTIKHGKVVCFIGGFIKLGFLNALISDEEVGENIPSFLGRGDGSKNALSFSESDMWMRCKAEALSCLWMVSQGSKLFKSLEIGLNPCSMILQSSIDTKFM
jgi:hypothetical protein